MQAPRRDALQRVLTPQHNGYFLRRATAVEVGDAQVVVGHLALPGLAPDLTHRFDHLLTAASAGAVELTSAMLNECAAIAAANGFAPRAGALDRYTAMLTSAGSPFTASMLRDIEAGMPIEADHVLGDPNYLDAIHLRHVDLAEPLIRR